MIITAALIIGIGIYEVRKMLENRQYREIKTWIMLAIISIALAIIYNYVNYSNSLSLILLRLIGMEY